MGRSLSENEDPDFYRHILDQDLSVSQSFDNEKAINVAPLSTIAEETELLEKLRSSPNFAPQPGKSEKGFFHKVRDMFS